MTQLGRFSRSLAFRILVLLVVALLFPLILNAIHVIEEARSAEIRIQAEAQSIATTSAIAVADVIADFIATAKSVELYPAFWEGSDEDRDRILTFIGAPQTVFTALLFYTNDLEQHGSSTPASQTGNRVSAANREYAREAIATGQIAFTSTPLFALRTGIPVLPMAIPIREAGPKGRVGLFVGGTWIERLPALWNRSSLPTGTAIVLADLRSGRLLVGKGGAVADERTLSPIVLDRMRGGDNTFRHVAEDGVERLLLWAPVARSPWIVLVDTPVSEIFGPVRSAAATRLITGTIITVLIAIGLFVFWQRVTSRLGTLRKSAESWGREEWRHRTGISGSDEIGTLATAFDHMAALVQKTSLLLAEQNQDRDRTLRRRLALLHVAREAATAVDQDQILDVIYAEASDGIGGDMAAVSLWDSSRKVLVPIRHNMRPPVVPIPLGHGIAGRAALQRASINMPNYQQQVADDPAIRQSGIQNAIATPMLHDSELLGIIFVGRDDPQARFDSEDVEFLEMLAGIAAAELIGYQRARFAGALLAARTAEHELNNRLTRVIGFSQLMAMAARESPKLRELAEQVLEGANEAVAVVNQLRQITHIEETEWGAGIGSTINLDRSQETTVAAVPAPST